MVKIGNFLFKYRNALLPLLFLGVFVPSEKMFDHPTTALWIGISVALAGQVVRALTIGLKYIVRGGRDKKVYADTLVTTGIFSHTRNPMYIGNIMVVAGIGLASNNLIFFSSITLLIIFIYQAIVLAEEDFLRRKFEGSYDYYAQKVNRWVPSLSKIGQTLFDSSFAWRRLIVKEYNSTYTGLSLCILLIAKAVYDNPEYYPDADHVNLTLVVTWIALTICYVTIKFLKKTKQIKAEA